MNINKDHDERKNSFIYKNGIKHIKKKKGKKINNISFPFYDFI